MTAMMRFALLALFPLLLTGCDVIKERMGIKDPIKLEAEAKAIGASCRLSGRSLEDCYNLNDSYPRAPIYTGWKEMNEYMAERKMEAQPPKLDAHGKPIGHEEPAATKETGKDTGKDNGKDAGKETSKDAKSAKGDGKETKPDAAEKESIKDIRPKKPDLAKEVGKH